LAEMYEGLTAQLMLHTLTLILCLYVKFNLVLFITNFYKFIALNLLDPEGSSPLSSG